MIHREKLVGGHPCVYYRIPHQINYMEKLVMDAYEKMFGQRPVSWTR